jgi:hypothetical protein
MPLWIRIWSWVAFIAAMALAVEFSEWMKRTLPVFWQGVIVIGLLPVCVLATYLLWRLEERSKRWPPSRRC